MDGRGAEGNGGRQGEGRGPGAEHVVEDLDEVVKQKYSRDDEEVRPWPVSMLEEPVAKNSQFYPCADFAIMKSPGTKPGLLGADVQWASYE